MKINIDMKNGVAVLKATGNLDADSVAQFKKEANKIIEEGCFRIVVDFKTLEFVDSMGLGALISLLRKVRTSKGDLKIASLSKEVRTIFEITRLHCLFEILPDAETACRTFT